MTREQYDALVHRLEEDAARKPAGYRLRVLLLALLGYAYVIGVLVGVVVLGVVVLTLAFRWHLGILAGKLAIPLVCSPGSCCARSGCACRRHRVSAWTAARCRSSSPSWTACAQPCALLRSTGSS